MPEYLRHSGLWTIPTDESGFDGEPEHVPTLRTVGSVVTQGSVFSKNVVLEASDHLC